MAVDFVFQSDVILAGNAQRYLIENINEGQSDASFVSLRYRVDCESNTRVVRDWTDIASPSSPYVLVIEAADLGIIDSNNRIEMKVVTVQSDFGTKSQKTGSIEIPVRNARP